MYVKKVMKLDICIHILTLLVDSIVIKRHQLFTKTHSMYHSRQIFKYLPSLVAQSVTCLATDESLTADPGVTSSVPVQSHTFVEIDHEIISTVILLPSAESFKKGCCQL